MNRLLSLFAVLAVSLFAVAQSYTFESDYTNWSAQQGTLALTTDHYKGGKQSLQWTTSGKSVLLIKGFTQFSTTNSNSCFMHIYLPEATNDTLVVEFLNGTVARRTARMVCNYKGWREFNRAYTEYATTSAVNISAVRMTLYPTDSKSRTLCFDNVSLNTTVDTKRVPGTQWVLDVDYMTNNTNPLSLYANPVDLPLTEPTAQELADLQTIIGRVKDSASYNAPQAIIVKNWVNTNLKVVRNTDGSLLNGTVLNMSAAGLVADSLYEIGARLLYLAGGKLKGVEAVGQAFDDYLDLLLDQGLGAGAPIAFASNSYTAPRTAIPYFVSILPSCNDRQKAEVIEFIKWLSYYGICYYPEDEYLSHLSSDVVYLFLPYMYTAVAQNPDKRVAVRDLHAVQRFMNRSMDYVPGGGDILKPDGTGFHHNSHYNNYMYSYQTFVAGVYNFRNTEFALSETAYTHFAKAVLSLYTMATGGTGDNRFYANSLSGRNPFAAGSKITFTKSQFKNLIASGDAYPEAQTELKKAYNYFFQAAEYTDEIGNNYDGVYQFNYSPIAVVRHGSWVATMRAPTSKFWGAEIYSGENRFGRYQSHGSLEVMYEGSSLAASGYPTNSTGGGWDWNVVPGATTVHYTSWAEMMPKQNTSQRMDQYSNGTNFAGALADDQVGVFAANLSQTDRWGSSAVLFTPTNLTAHKSVFIFDTLLVALGSNINSSGTYSDDRITATNLFQSLISTGLGALVVNGTEVKSAYSETLPAGSNWLLSPTGTGYYLPATNSGVQVFYGSQTTPKETGADYQSPTTTATAAKAYINHGSKCNDKQYAFVVVPATTPEAMESLARQMDAGTVYTIYQQDGSVHAVGCGNTIGYAFYSAAQNLSYGIVRSTTHQHLLTDTYDETAQKHYFAACNPNLEPVSDATYSWVSSPTTTTLVLDGEWTVRSTTTPSGSYSSVDSYSSVGSSVSSSSVDGSYSVEDSSVSLSSVDGSYSANGSSFEGSSSVDDSSVDDSSKKAIKNFLNSRTTPEGRANESASSLVSSTIVDGHTEVVLSFMDGEPIYFEAVPGSAMSIDEAHVTDCRILHCADQLLITWQGSSVDRISLYAADGSLVHTCAVAPSSRSHTISLDTLPVGAYICRAGASVLKFIK